MDKVISFGKGIRRQPSIGDAGELSELVNLIPKNGELVNVGEITPLDKTLEGNDVLVHVHQTMSGDNYIAIGKTDGSTSLVYYNDKWERVVIDTSLLTDGDVLPNIESIGNTVVLLLKGGVRYYLWKDGKYMNLGNKPPQIDISFGLQGECVRTEDIIELSPPKGFSASKDANGNLTGVAYFEEDKDFINDKVLGEVNKFINSESVEKGRFIYPFLIRYAYRMYDESLIMHSSPVLMVCSTACAPSFVVEEARNVSNGNSPTLECRVMGVTHKLDYSIDTDAISEKLEGWSDIIKSVDVFVSPQIYTYDPNGEVGRIRTSDTLESNGYAICKHINQKDKYANEEGYLKQYQKRYINEMYATTFSDDWSYVASHFELPSKTEEEVLGALKNESLFYLLDTITIDKLPEKGKRTIIEVKDDILQTLTTREVMSDDYYSNDGLSAEYAKSYNSRLSLSGVERVLYDGKLVSSVFPYTDGFVIKDATTQWMNGTQDVRYAVYIKEDGKDIVVGGDLTLSKYGVIEKRLNRLLYFFYPNPNAYKLVVEAKLYVDEGGSFVPSPNFYKYTVALERHNLLNGAFFFNGWENGILETSNIKGLTVESGYSSTINNLVSSDKSVRQRGQVYTSDTSNPFFFFPSGISQIGYGDVIRIETSAKALSPSQFGQFPLYAFCTDGIWALEVTKDGTYLPPKIVSNDVCNNPNSITQIESSVVFTTDQGLKLIQGSEAVLLSGQMDGHNVNERVYFPEGFFAGYGHEKYDKLVTPPVTDDFRTILATSKIAYDYPNRLLRIYPKSGDKWYVYSLDSQEFSSEEPLDDGVKAVVAGYPTSLIQVGGGLYTFRNEASDDMRDGLLLTRPIDMGEPFALKKLHDMRTLYTKYSDGTFVKVVIYVSNDGVSWAVLPSLRRGSFKYYRLAIITRMTDADRLSGTVMRYTVERNNKLR